MFRTRLTDRSTGLRALQNAAETWGDSDLYFLKSALKLGGEFDNWGGFGSGNI